MNEQDRINAMISYFFLGPLFLVAKKGTPLANSYVRGHAKKASSIIGISFLIYIIYAFLLKGFIIGISLPGGIGLHTIVLALIVGVCILFLLS